MPSRIATLKTLLTTSVVLVAILFAAVALVLWWRSRGGRSAVPAESGPLRSWPALDWLFAAQDTAAASNITASELVRKRLDFLNVALGIAVDTLSDLPFSDEKQHAMRTLSMDAWSSVTSAIRVALWGNLPESFAILRVALETATILAAAVGGQRYKTAVMELGQRQRQLSYKQALESRGDAAPQIERLHGDLTNWGAHATGSRMRLAAYQYEGEAYDRFGCSLDPEAAAVPLRFAVGIALDLLHSLETAHLQEGRVFPLARDLDRLRGEFARVSGGDASAEEGLSDEDPTPAQ